MSGNVGTVFQIWECIAERPTKWLLRKRGREKDMCRDICK